jgi:hypothetical protein
MAGILDEFTDVTVQVHNLGGNLPMEISRMDQVFQFCGTAAKLLPGYVGKAA